jgi:putative restriction endonuclease
VPVPDLDQRVRLQAFAFLAEQMERHGEVLSRDVLAAGFRFEGTRVPLLDPQGIFKPAILPELPLSLTTVPIVEGQDRPYEDEVGPDGLLRYRYRGTDPAHRDNQGLRRAIARRVPLIYLFGVVPGQYMPVWPIFIVGDDPGALTFTVAVDDARIPLEESAAVPDSRAEGRRFYVTTLTLRRLHQQSFRQRAPRAYQARCAICRLGHDELLEAAHILPDGHPRGAPIVPDGLALCKLHHAAFDRYVLGIRPDLTVDLRRGIRDEVNGPMLKHGLQGFQDARIFVARAAHLRPRSEFLAERYELFRQVG